LKLLLDECVHVDFRLHLSGHEAFTVAYLGWKGIKNGKLLDRAAADGFDALLTIDREIEFQQNLASLPIALVILEAASPELEDLLVLLPILVPALDQLQKRSLVKVSPP
jgi:hypothetical protein